MDDAQEMVEDEVGLILSDRSDDGAITTGGVKLERSRVKEGAMQQFDGGDERFAPAVAGDQNIFARL